MLITLMIKKTIYDDDRDFCNHGYTDDKTDDDDDCDDDDLQE